MERNCYECVFGSKLRDGRVKCRYLGVVISKTRVFLGFCNHFARKEVRKEDREVKILMKLAHNEGFDRFEINELLKVIYGFTLPRGKFNKMAKEVGILVNRGRRMKVKKLPLAVLKAIKQKREAGYGLHYIQRYILRKFGIYLSIGSLWNIFHRYGIENLIKDAEERDGQLEKEISEILEMVNAFVKKEDEQLLKLGFEGWIDWLIKAEEEIVQILSERPLKALFITYKQLKDEYDMKGKPKSGTACKIVEKAIKARVERFSKRVHLPR